MSTIDSAPSHWAQRYLRWVLLGYALLLATGTHIPSTPRPVVVMYFDKVVHLLAYGGLAGLSAACIAQWRGRLSLRSAALLWITLLVVGAVDELTQPMVGRSCELADWIADATGALAAIIFYVSITQTGGSSSRSAAVDP